MSQGGQGVAETPVVSKGLNLLVLLSLVFMHSCSFK